MIERIAVYYDGVTDPPATGLPKSAAWAYAILINDHLETSKSFQLIHPEPELNCKFHAIFDAINWLVDHDKTEANITFFNDDLSPANLMNKLWKPKENIKTLWRECMKLAYIFNDLHFVWVSKEQNRESRALALQAMNAGFGERPLLNDETRRKSNSGAVK